MSSDILQGSEKNERKQKQHDAGNDEARYGSLTPRGCGFIAACLPGNLLSGHR
jgi:hypothetical protein